MNPRVSQITNHTISNRSSGETARTASVRGRVPDMVFFVKLQSNARWLTCLAGVLP
jgi:hypothetical protein